MKKATIVEYLHYTKGWKMGSPPANLKGFAAIKWSDGKITRSDVRVENKIGETL